MDFYKILDYHLFLLIPQLNQLNRTYFANTTYLLVWQGTSMWNLFTAGSVSLSLRDQSSKYVYRWFRIRKLWRKTEHKLINLHKCSWTPYSCAWVASFSRAKFMALPSGHWTDYNRLIGMQSDLNKHAY